MSKKPSARTKRRKKSPSIPGKAGPDWGMLKDDEIRRPGATLLALLMEAANTRGLSMQELAREGLGVTYSHFAGLRNGDREIPKIGEDIVERISQFLGLPKVVVMLAAGQLRLEDFYQDPKVVQTHLEPALQFIQRDPEVGPYMPPTAFTCDAALRRFIVMLYERASGRLLLPSKVTPEEIAERYKILIDTERT